MYSYDSSESNPGIHERIAHGIAEEIRKVIPCHVEGPVTPQAAGWANIHIDGLGNASVTISLFGGTIWLANFTNCLLVRKSRPDHYDHCIRRYSKEMAEPDSVEWIIKHAIREIVDDGSVIYNRIPRDIRIQKLWEYHQTRAPASVLFGRPYYLI